MLRAAMMTGAEIIIFLHGQKIRNAIIMAGGSDDNRHGSSMGHLALTASWGVHHGGALGVSK